MSTLITPDATDGHGPRHWTPGTQVIFTLDTSDSGTVDAAEFLFATATGATLIAGFQFTTSGLAISAPGLVTVVHTITAAEAEAIASYVGTIYCFGRVSIGGVFDPTYTRGGSGFTTVNSAPAPLEASFQPTGAVNTSLNPSFTMRFDDADVDRISRYQIIIQTSVGAAVADLGVQSINQPSGVDFTVTPSLTLTDLQQYRWFARAWDSLGKVSADSIYHYFTAAAGSSGSNYNGTGTTAGSGGIIGTGVSGGAQEDLTYTPSPQGTFQVTSASFPFNVKDRFININISKVRVVVYQKATQTNSYTTLVWDSGYVNYTPTSQGLVEITGISLQVGISYSWKMYVTDDTGAVTATSSSHIFTGSASGSNVPPTVTIVSPKIAAVGQKPTFIANFADSGSVFNQFSSYQIEVRKLP